MLSLESPLATGKIMIAVSISLYGTYLVTDEVCEVKNLYITYTSINYIHEAYRNSVLSLQLSRSSYMNHTG